MIANVNTILPFDANETETKEVSFTQTSSAQITTYKVLIYQEMTQVQSSPVINRGISETSGVYIMNVKNLKDLNVLRNGQKYRIIVISVDQSGNYTDTITKQTGQVFFCYTVPRITFLNINDGQLINGSYTFRIRYSQSDGVFMTSGSLQIYTISDLTKPRMVIPFPANQKLDEHQGKATTYEITVNGLKENRIYYLGVAGLLASTAPGVNGGGAGYMQFESQIEQFKPFNGDAYGVYNFMTATNNPIVGGIVLGTDIKSATGLLYDKDGNLIPIETIDGTIDQDLFDQNKIIFSNGDRGITVRDGKELRFQDGWSARNDFSIILYLTHMDLNEQVFHIFLNKDPNEEVFYDDPTIETVGSLYWREGKHRSTDIHGYLEQVVETKFTEPKTDEIPNPQPMWYRRVYHSQEMSDYTWEKWKNLQYTWGAFNNGGIKWRQLKSGIMLDDIICVMIGRQDNEWSLNAARLDEIIKLTAV